MKDLLKDILQNTNLKNTPITLHVDKLPCKSFIGLLNMYIIKPNGTMTVINLQIKHDTDCQKDGHSETILQI